MILMHNRSSWVHAEIKEQLGGRYIGMEYSNLVEDICNELMESVELAHLAGVADENISLIQGLVLGRPWNRTSSCLTVWMKFVRLVTRCF